MGEKREIKAWIGFVDGEPHQQKDENYDVKHLLIYRRKVDAQTCFQDVRKCTITVESHAH